MLSGAAAAIAGSLSQFPSEFLASNDNRFSDSQLYNHLLTSAPLMDGYFDDWSLEETSLGNLAGRDGTIRYAIGSYRQYVYAYIAVPDAELYYRSGNDDPSDSDYVSLVLDDEQGGRSRLLFMTEAPGPINVQRSVGNNIVAESRVIAHWQDTANGYQIEARIPRNLLSSHVGIEVNNSDGSTAALSRTFFPGPPGRFVSPSQLLTSVAEGYVQEGMRIIIVDTAGWRLAEAGTLSSAENRAASPPSGWRRFAYRTLLEQGTQASLAEPDPSGRENQNYIARALNGEPSTRWFRNAETGRAVVAVAQPIWSGNVRTGALVLQQDTDAIISLTNASLMRLIIFTVIATLGVVLVLITYASWLSGRIRKLSHAADHALDNARMATGLPSALAGDEVGDLSRSFSNVLRQLESYNDYLRTLASKLSHELRTPLTIVTSSLENLDHEPLSEQSREYTARAREGADRLKKMLNAMSEVNRVEQLIENAEIEEFDLRVVLTSIVAAYRDAWPDRRFAFSAAEQPFNVTGSPELIVQLLDKLVDNAVDFTSDADQIDITLDRSAEYIRLTVANPGPHLPEDMRHRLFESMVSIRQGSSGDNLGLGLNIAKLIADGHGGTIEAYNMSSGVCFEVRLPSSNAKS